MVVGIIGSKVHTQYIMNLLKKNRIEGVDLNNKLKGRNIIIKFKNYISYIKTLRRVDMVYVIGQAAHINLRLIIAKLFKKIVINHWIGTDVLIARKKKIHRKINQFFIDVNLASAPWLKNELMELGINATLLPIIPAGMRYEVAKMPKEHSVLVYMPEGRESFYGKKYIEYLAKEFPNIRFFIVANSNKELIKLKNVTFLGKLSLNEMEALYDKISILIRLPEHDGLSLMLLEALVKGKQVIYKYKFPYVYTPLDINNLREIFEEIIKKPPRVNYEASEFIKNNYNEKVIFNELMNILNSVKNKKK